MPHSDPKYRERMRVQALEWAKGNPQHNRIDDECCPDFSCCMPDLFTKDDSERWQQYHDTYGRKQ